MNVSPQTENRKNVLRNDRLLACSMLAVYGVCLLGLIAATLWGTDRRNKTLIAHATSTAFAAATQQANVTATAVALLSEQDHYEFVERFDEDTTRWFTGKELKEYGDVNAAIRGGVYIWKIVDPQGYIQGRDVQFYKAINSSNFDVYIDLKFIENPGPKTVCSGLVFRKSPKGWDDGAYVFSICDDSHYEVYYVADAWDSIESSNSAAISETDWNRIAIHARDDHFSFDINNLSVYEMTDDRQENGSIGIYIDVADDQSAEFWFDNFGFQSR